MTGLRLLTDEEVAAYCEAPADELLYPPAHRYRWHCTACGRFVRNATVRKLPAYRWEDEDEWRGTCSVDGENMDVTWGPR